MFGLTGGLTLEPEWHEELRFAPLVATETPSQGVPLDAALDDAVLTYRAEKQGAFVSEWVARLTPDYVRQQLVERKARGKRDVLLMKLPKRALTREVALQVFTHGTESLHDRATALLAPYSDARIEVRKRGLWVAWGAPREKPRYLLWFALLVLFLVTVSGVLTTVLGVATGWFSPPVSPCIFRPDTVNGSFGLPGPPGISGVAYDAVLQHGQ